MDISLQAMVSKVWYYRKSSQISGMRFGYMFEGQKGVRSGGSAEKRSADKAVQPAAFVAPHKYICLSSGLHFERAKHY